MKRIVGKAPDDELDQSQSQAPPASPASPPPAENPPVRRTRPRQTGPSLSPEAMEILVPSLKAGALAGTCGAFNGAAWAIFRSVPTVLFSVVAGGQCFVLGSSYYATRLVGLKHLANGIPTPRDKLKASTIAGCVAGTCGGLLRGPRNILPSAFMFSLFGAGGQAILNRWDAKVANAPPKPAKEVGFWARWSPITQLSDKDYEKILEERLLRVEADIAVVDDHIRELREAESRDKKVSAAEAQGGEQTSSGKV